ncbi:DUF2577 domain-containing protein [Paenibacillus sp. N1-5-1-14]|uniref:DUF2577 domain-containing protein n=1 Tax=Paenibacillus radicibacter TaxID=2972488 RepID=UPI0021599170|nr:DUF2577 domain-containing protein [Paenibacillus radicibacter]MCR8645589.1 DUF2577 domain-containing protein [Paenibacillus radicibacter]
MSMSWMINLIREQGAKYNPPSLLFGEVLSLHPEMKIKLGDLVLSKSFLLVAEHLLHSRVKGSQVGVVHEVELSPPLAIGDTVAVMPTTDFQRYVVLCKVVGT